MAVTRNPCRYCAEASEYNGRHQPSNLEGCLRCTYRDEYEKYLESKRQFMVGEPITDIAELLGCEWVLWYGNTKHIEVFRSMPIRTVEMFLRHGAFNKAIRKGEM